jgi:hypothetical protein
MNKVTELDKVTELENMFLEEMKTYEYVFGKESVPFSQEDKEAFEKLFVKHNISVETMYYVIGNYECWPNDTYSQDIDGCIKDHLAIMNKGFCHCERPDI